ncbi:MAG: hypothetical protein ABEL76_13435 [Bradymonadaceae bacterium]
MLDGLIDVFRGDRVRKVVITLYGIAIAGLAATYIGVSTREVPTAAYIRGERRLRPGETFALRGAILNAPRGTFRRDVSVSVRLGTGEAGDPGRTTRLVELQPSSNGTFSTAVRVPGDWPPGAASLVFEVRGSDIERFRASTRVDVRNRDEGEAYWPEASSRLDDSDRREELAGGPVVEQSGPVAIDVLPPDGEVVRGLESRLYLRTVRADDGEPVSCRVRVLETEGAGDWSSGGDLPDTLRTDAMGLTEIAVTLPGGQRWRLSADRCRGLDAAAPSPAGRATLRIHTVPAQFSVDLASSLARPGRRLGADVRKLISSGGFYVDLYGDGSWMAAERVETNQSGELLRVAVPQTFDGRLIRLQVHDALFESGGSWAVDHAVRADGRTDRERLRNALRTTATMVAERRDAPYYDRLRQRIGSAAEDRSIEELRRWLDALLEAVPRRFDAGDVLLNTQKEDREELADWKRHRQNELMYLLVAALFGAAALLAWVVARGLGEQRAHARRLREIDDELAGEAEGAEGAETPKWGELEMRERLSILSMGVVAFVTLVLFGFGLVLVLSLL